MALTTTSTSGYSRALDLHARKLSWDDGRSSLRTVRGGHGLGEAEILHADRNPVRIWDLGDGFTMIVGPNQSAIFLEVGYVDGDQVHVIVHAMKAREKFLR